MITSTAVHANARSFHRFVLQNSRRIFVSVLEDEMNGKIIFVLILKKIEQDEKSIRGPKMKE